MFHNVSIWRLTECQSFANEFYLISQFAFSSILNFLQYDVFQFDLFEWVYNKWSLNKFKWHLLSLDFFPYTFLQYFMH